MTAQPRSKIDKLIAQFPFLGLIRSSNSREIGGKMVIPEMSVAVQKPDNEMMYLQANNIRFGGSSYTSKSTSKDDNRATRKQTVMAFDVLFSQVAALDWQNYENRWEVYLKDIFTESSYNKIHYLAWVSVYDWYTPTTEKEYLEEKGLFKDYVKTTLEIILYIKPKNINWRDLVEQAEKEKKERDEAYLYNPKVMPDFPGIHRALVEGCKLHAFQSGGGLRVVSLSLKNKERGYGEHPHIEEALAILEEDFLAGGRPYNEVYGTGKPHIHYLTGSIECTSNLDYWIRKGCTFDCWQNNGTITFSLKGYQHLQVPSWVVIGLKRYMSLVFQERGFWFVAENVPEDDGSFQGQYSVHVIDAKKGANKEDALFYPIEKTGTGRTFWDAMTAAFAAEEKYVPK